MSRLAKKPIEIPDGVKVEFADGVLKVSGPKGELGRNVPRAVLFDISSKEVAVKPAGNPKETSSFLGTWVRHLQNMIYGVTKGFEKKLELEGVGFKAEVKGKELVLSLGFSHQVAVVSPPGISFAVEKNIITISGADKEAVGNVAAVIRSKRKPEPYKGKGIHYKGEVIRRKSGKKVAASA